MMTELLPYNAFGLITVTKKKITVNVTSQAEKRYISRSVSNEYDLKEVEPNETVLVTFGAWMEAGKKSLVTFHQQGQRDGEPVTEIQEVNALLEEALNTVKKSAFGLSTK